jgi:hypothetical protein
MIRDPSDGSVKEPQKPEVGIPATKSEAGPILDTTTSGLPTGSSKPENIARLEKSREWLRDYRAGKFKQTDGEGK